MKGEKKMWFIVGGIFFVALILIDIFWAKWDAMSTPMLVVAIGGHILSAAFAWASIKYFDDPNKDKFRYLTVVLVALTAILICAHKAGWLENEMFKQDVEKAKQEQTK